MYARLIRLLVRGLGHLPLRTAHAIGAGVGRVAHALPTPARRITETNLRLCFPDMPPEERRTLARRSLVEQGRTIAELGALWTWDQERILSLVRGVSGDEYLRRAHAQGRGVILLAPHLGAWELTGLYCGMQLPLTALYRPLRIPELEPDVVAWRQRLGARLVRAGPGGIRELLQALRRGQAVGILPDQEPGAGQGVFAPFFGVPAYTMVLVSRLAARTGAPAILVHAERLPRSTGFHLHFAPAPPGLTDSDVEQACSHLNSAVEAWVRRVPEQYMWSYKRFGKRPKGIPKRYRRDTHGDT